MQIALTYPEVYDLARFKEKRKEFPPFGVLYLAAVLEKEGYNVVIFKINPEQESFDFRGFDIVGFSTPSSATYNLTKKARFSSIYSEGVTIAVGGIHAGFYPEMTIRNLEADVLAIGSAEDTIIEIVQAHVSKDFSKIKGICYRRGESVLFTDKREIRRSIDMLPMPSRHLLDISDLVMSNRLARTDTRMTHIMLSRGCPFSCHFCAVMQKKIQHRSGQNIKAELIHLMDLYGIEGFAIVDDNFVVNKKMVLEACSAILDLNLKWSALSRVDTVDYELLQVMHDAGCIEIKFGVESGSERMLKAMGKNVSRNQIKKAIALANAVGIRVKVFLVHGFPGENLESTKETMSLLHELKGMIDRVSLFRFVPLPGSYVFRNPDEFDLHLPEDISDWSSFHIYRNNKAWWGDESDFAEMEFAYHELLEFVEKHCP